MWQRVDSLFKPHVVALDEVDVRKFVERYLRSVLRARGLYCDEVKVKQGRVKVRTSSPGLCREVRLRQYDLAQVLAGEAGMNLTELIVTQS